MEIRIQSIHFDASQQLQDFVQKKAARLARRYPMIDNTKTADTFEEANDLALEAIERQLEKIKIDK